MKKLLLLITGLLLLFSVEGQILRYSNYTAPTPPEEETNDFLTNLVAYWAFEESSGTLDDSQGSNNSASCSADYGSTGISGNCLSFTAANSDYVGLTDADALRMYDQDFTFVAWINPSAYPAAGAYAGIFGGENASAGLSLYNTVAEPDNGILRVRSIATADGPLSTLVPSLSSWSMIAVVFDSNATTNNVTYYLNGTTQVGTGNFDFSIDRGTIYIGRESTSGAYYSGLIDEAMIWKSRKLTTDELDDLYNSGTGLFFTDFN